MHTRLVIKINIFHFSCGFGICLITFLQQSSFNKSRLPIVLILDWLRLDELFQCIYQLDK